MDKIELRLTYTVFDTIDELDEEGQQLITAAKEFAQNAYAPYSNFNVGAALLLENGKIVHGSNQENAAYPSGLCAERVAFFSASANYPNVRIRRVAVVARRNHESDFLEASPCGSCRQVMMEYEEKQSHPVEIILMGNKGKVLVMPSIETLLPFKFTARSL